MLDTPRLSKVGRFLPALSCLLLSSFLGLGRPSHLSASETITELQPASQEQVPQPSTTPAKTQTETGTTTPTKARQLPARSPRPGALSPAETNRLIFEWKYTINHTSIQGNTERSFLHPGNNHIAEFSTFLNQGVLGVRRLESMFLFRYTDDPRVDPERNSLQRGYLRLRGPSFEVNLGDTMASYSRFTMNQNTKGANGWKDFPDLGLRIKATAGTFSNRWGELFRTFDKFRDPRQSLDPQFPNKPFTRLVLGTRVEKKIADQSFVALNFSQGSDVIRSLPRETLLLPFNNKVFSVDGGFRRNSLQAAGELAYSLTQFDSRIQRSARKDYAARAEVSQRLRRFNWRADYARFMPNFFSVNARQVQDLQDASARVSYDLNSRFSLAGSYRRTNDNLAGRAVIAANGLGVPQVLTNRGRTLGIGSDLRAFDRVVDPNGVPMTTVVQQPEVRLTMSRLPPSKHLQLSFGYRQRVFSTNNKSSFDSTSGRALFSDRVTRIPFMDLDYRLTRSLFSLGYEYRDNIDHAQNVNSTRTNRFVLAYRGTYFLGNFAVSPTLRFETEREAKELEGARSPHDQTRSIQGSVIIDFPRYYSLELFYRELNAALLSRLPATEEFLFGNAGFHRPYFRAALTYKIRNSEDHYIVASFERSVNTFRHPDPNQPDVLSFRENVFQITFFYRLRR